MAKSASTCVAVPATAHCFRTTATQHHGFRTAATQHRGTACRHSVHELNEFAASAVGPVAQSAGRRVMPLCYSVCGVAGLPLQQVAEPAGCPSEAPSPRPKLGAAGLPSDWRQSLRLFAGLICSVAFLVPARCGDTSRLRLCPFPTSFRLMSISHPMRSVPCPSADDVVFWLRGQCAVL